MFGVQSHRGDGYFMMRLWKGVRAASLSHDATISSRLLHRTFTYITPPRTRTSNETGGLHEQAAPIKGA